MSMEAREDRLTSLAMDVLEERLLNKTASSQEVTTVLKNGLLKTRLELEKLRQENELLKAKTEAIQSQKHSEELYAEAIKAFKDYAGFGEEEDDPEDY